MLPPADVALLPKAAYMADAASATAAAGEQQEEVTARKVQPELRIRSRPVTGVGLPGMIILVLSFIRCLLSILASWMTRIKVYHKRIQMCRLHPGAYCIPSLHRIHRQNDGASEPYILVTIVG